ncbi:MAG TPA: epoxyqueuosine reductase [Candidatus Hydrogenedentes bacterium]|nr:epoxyqueuosine reductase [Candidatus Hydrogenedentota bacterium]
MEVLAERVQTHARDLGATFAAFADLRALPKEVRKGLPIGISLGLALDPAIVTEIADGPTPAYAAEYERANRRLEDIADGCAALLREGGYKAEAGRPTVGNVEAILLETHLPHKTVATLAGVGWIGKCALLITEEYGSAVRYNTVLTDAPLPTAEPIRTSRCGSCEACVLLCPVDAVSGREWTPDLQRDDLYDAFACLDHAYDLVQSRKIRHAICGMCIAACPYTQRYIERARAAPVGPEGAST